MRKTEIAALVRAHRNRAQPVAFFHILRQPALEADDHAFLLEHIDELGASDLLRWRARSEKGERSPVIQQLAALALRDEPRFRHEVLDAPRLGFEEAEWLELSDLLRGKVDDETWARIEARGVRPEPPAHPHAGAGPREESFSLDDAELGGGASGEGGISFLDGLDDGEGDFGLSFGGGEGGEAPGELREPPAEAEDWSPNITRFPPSFKDAVLAKAKSTPRGDERTILLEWLAQQGVDRKTMVEIAAGSFASDASGASGPIAASLLTWLSKQLSNRAAWDQEGTAVLVPLINRRAFSEISDLFTFTWNEASASADEDASRVLLTSMQLTFALSLIQVARGAVTAGRPDQAMAALSALACLAPPSRVSQSIHDLRALPGVGEEVLHLIEVNERLVKHGDARDASLEGIVAAVHALADAFV